MKIDGNEVTTDDEALALIDELGKDGDLDLEVRHGDSVSTKNVKTYLCPETGSYRLGLYIRDNTGGIGTLTFYEPESNRYGALGHPIAEAAQGSSEEPLGRVLSASVNGIKKRSPVKQERKLAILRKAVLMAPLIQFPLTAYLGRWNPFRKLILWMRWNLPDLTRLKREGTNYYGFGRHRN